MNIKTATISNASSSGYANLSTDLNNVLVLKAYCSADSNYRAFPLYSSGNLVLRWYTSANADNMMPMLKSTTLGTVTIIYIQL